MRKFEFRLQKVLDYRETMEHWAQEAYLDTRVARLEAEAALYEVRGGRERALRERCEDLNARKLLEMTLQKLDDDEKAQQSVVDVLAAEEEKALAVWHEKKQELETMIKLRDKALEAWELEASRKEQAELDEWSVLKRGAA